MQLYIDQPIPGTNPEKEFRNKRKLIKAHCSLCSHYYDCPRMKGQNICYGKKELIAELPLSPTDSPIASVQE